MSGPEIEYRLVCDGLASSGFGIPVLVHEFVATSDVMAMAAAETKIQKIASPTYNRFQLERIRTTKGKRLGDYVASWSTETVARPIRQG